MTSMQGRRWATAEGQRVLASPSTNSAWKNWGPYVAEREWGTVREDYSPDGRAWQHFTHQQARFRAYRWGEDGLGAICDRYQTLVFGLALWNHADPFLKERAFGLVPDEANHGEDVKEYYHYLDCTPTHSYMKYLYRYPQQRFPYEELLRQNQSRRGTTLPEFELADTGVLDEGRFFDVVVEYAKAAETDLAIRITVCNHGPDAALLDVIPQLWFRNQWSWEPHPVGKPRIFIHDTPAQGTCCLQTDSSLQPSPQSLPQDYRLPAYYLQADAAAKLLFTENESNAEQLWGKPSSSPFTKDAFHRQIVNGEVCTNPQGIGTKAALHFGSQEIAAGSIKTYCLRLSTHPPDESSLADVERVIHRRKVEADDFFAAVHPPGACDDECRVQRQAIAGMLWSKQAYIFDVDRWTRGDDPQRPPSADRQRRNQHWQHLNSMRVLSMPDKWEFPWFAAWDLAFHTLPLALVDPGFAKEQLWLLLFEQFIHPNGQIPAYEWEFSDVNPPVHAWAVWRVYNMDRVSTGKPDRNFLETCFHKLLLNFTWWVNKVDHEGNNIFEGGFLGLDNITVIERSTPPPDNAVLEQSDATGWMGMYCLNMMRIALELAKHNSAYEPLATKFFEHFVRIGASMKQMGSRGYQLWDEEDGFFYDVLRYPDGHFSKLRIRSLVGLIPLFAVERLEEKWINQFPSFQANFHWFLDKRKTLVDECITTMTHEGEVVHVLAMMRDEQMTRLLKTLVDPKEFWGPFGVRSLSRFHQDQPFSYGDDTVTYEPGESASHHKGGNSNWRGPVWMPTNFLVIETLRKLHKAYRGRLSLADPQGGAALSLEELAEQLANHLLRIFRKSPQGSRPCFGPHPLFRSGPWQDQLLFFEHFDAESGRGLGASHQTGWTGLVANLIDEWRH